jgi:dihydrofolate synthase / folylpolyglutamate synthase
MNYNKTLAHIFSRGRFGIKPGLERVTELLSRLGDPQRNLKTVQIAGTNGKGSTGAFLSSIMTHAGCRTAFFSSPHLSRFSERFRINDVEISETVLHRAADRVLKAAPEEATFFEIVTTIALLCFAEEQVDLAVIEAGMGGRSDATNIVDSLLSIITPISLDHCDYLGGTLSEIAREKAGVIKQGKPVVIAPQEEAVLTQLLSAAETTGSPAYAYGRDFQAEIGERGVSYYFGTFSLPDLKLSLQGRFQAENAVSAITAARLLGEAGFQVTAEAIRTGVAAAVWPGRLELFAGPPRILLDGAHNPAGAVALRRSLADFRYDRLILVFGGMADKSWQETLMQLLPLADLLVAVKPLIDRALAAGELADFGTARGMKATAAGGVKSGLEYASEIAGPDDLILVTGSLFTVGEARSILVGGIFMPIRG